MSATVDRQDALVLIFPDWSTTAASAKYLIALRDAAQAFVQDGRPVFYSTDPSHSEFPQVIRELVEAGAVPVPYQASFPPYVARRHLRRRAQREIDEVADVVGHPAGEIAIALGGLYRDGAVGFTAELWCREVEPAPDFPDMQASFLRPKRLFKRGRIKFALSR